MSPLAVRDCPELCRCDRIPAEDITTATERIERLFPDCIPNRRLGSWLGKITLARNPAEPVLARLLLSQNCQKS